MKKLLNLSLATAAMFLLTACVSSSSPSMETALKEDLNTVCSVEKSGIENVIATAKAYNEVAKAKGLEFRRLEVDNSNLITSVEEAIKTGAKEVNPKTFKGKPSKTKLPTDYAAQRACRFAISALQQADASKKTWRLAIPGDGYKY
ncbi:hypothetical protein [Halarcobacter anaerophilus]|jgi:hypothetical protein|uniref:Lipoprotein n=1 Tax=Halarcobacter anaerophilus TaxID=877500 RepID=A0A4Q0Y160_9BACT|nr:hypothetical protein [Halarcobacter anaerophilus]QDF29104.1 hypothetical protein AANAER_1628 [Halarcobacter anaerophilus]RXJ63732.1 hypothetical protein CRV06_05965 [Halarcobacter anaerophilus]